MLTSPYNMSVKIIQNIEKKFTKYFIPVNFLPSTGKGVGSGIK